MNMKTISKSQLKARMLEVFREIERTGEGIIVTDHGRPALRVEALPAQRSIEDVFGDLQNQVVYHEDIMTQETGEWPEV